MVVMFVVTLVVLALQLYNLSKIDDLVSIFEHFYFYVLIMRLSVIPILMDAHRLLYIFYADYGSLNGIKITLSDTKKKKIYLMCAKQ